MESSNGNSEVISWLGDKVVASVLVLLFTYLAFVLYIGPAFMKNRRPYKLKNILLAYNAVQVVISAYMTMISFQEILTFGLLPRTCYMSIEEHFNLVALGNRLYFFGKVTELLDTVFFVLRKKDNQISFLHLYHHSGMVFAWVVFRHHPSHVCTFLRFVNSAVHVIMYAYYGLSALGPNVAKYLKWKKYITTMQLVQFVAVVIYSIVTEFVSECPPTRAHAIFLTGNVIFILLLFVNFYKQSYMKNSKTVCDIDMGCTMQTADNRKSVNSTKHE